MADYIDWKVKFAEKEFRGKEKRTKDAAIELAYADMSRRQRGHTPAMKEECIKYLEGVFEKSSEMDNFNKWHKDQCDALIRIWNHHKDGFGTIGKAQKVLNMAFKYLSCITTDYDHLLPCCHMTLDSYTLDWYKRVVMPWVKDDKNRGQKDVKFLCEWSKIQNYDNYYMLIQDNIKEFLENATYSVKIGDNETKLIHLPKERIYAEFVIWKGEKIKKRYANLIEDMDSYLNENRHSDSWLIGTLFDKYLDGFYDRFKKL